MKDFIWLCYVIVVSFIMSSSVVQSLHGQDLQLAFHHLSQDDGLSEGINSYLLRDSRGFVWISSVYGLNRFDGKNVKTYLPDSHDPTALANGLINSGIFEDTNGDLWFTSNVAVQRYIRKKDHFETIRLSDERDSLVQEDIMAFHLDSSGDLWMRVGMGPAGRLHIYNTKTRKNRILYPLDGQRCTVINDDHGNVAKVVSSLHMENWGIEIIDHKSHEEKRLYDKKSRDPIYITNSWVENPNTIWFGSRSGLMKYDITSSSYRLFNQFQGDIGLVWSVIPYRDKLLVSTYQHGILVFERENEEFTQQFAQHQNRSNSLRQNQVSELYLDRDEVLWASLWAIGLDYGSFPKSKFKSLLSGMPEQSIWSIIEGPDNEIWCTTTSGYLIFDREHLLIEKDFKNPSMERQSQGPGKPKFFKDRQNRIWFIKGLELFLYDYTKRSFNLVPHIPDAPLQIISLSNGRTLMSTNLGVFELTIDASSNVLVNSPPEFIDYDSTSFEAMYEDRKGHVYFSRNAQSLLIFRLDGDHLTLRDEKKGLGDCKAFLEHQQSDSLWIATDAGVILLDQKNTFGYRLLKEAHDGLPAELYYCMIADADGKVWLSGNQGVIRYDPETRTHTRFTRADGLQSLEFITNAHCLSSTGEIWLGGSSGINVFNPAKIKTIPFSPQIQITMLLVNDELYDSDPYIGEINELFFDNEQNTLSFEFAGLEFSDPKAVEYRYRLVGLEDDWVNSGTRSFARYPNLPPGQYQFEVIASNSDGVWNTANPRTLKISIEPPFTQTAWFYLLLGLAGGSIAYFLYRFQLKRKLEIAEKKRLLELDNLKNRLYTNITHEFRTPLTLIHGPVSNALSTETSLDKKDLKSIYRQSERLQQLISQMLDLQKVEAGKLKPHYACGEIVQVIRYFVSSFETWAKEKGVSLVFSSAVDEVYMDYDEEKLTQIVSNLISNAIKHTPRNGKVSVGLNKPQEGNLFYIRIQDTGVGISKEDLPYIFDHYYQSSRAAVGGTGIGLALTKNLVDLLGGSVSVESTLDFGTTFEVALPVTANAQKASPKKTHLVESVSDEKYDDEAGFLPIENITSEKPLVLIVEDHPEVSQYVASCLPKDFLTLSAMDGNDGLRKAYEYIPDLIISDIMMPGKDGFELCAALKTDIQTSHIPIILLTGKGDQASLISGIEHGADAYVVKPFDPQELLLRVKKLLELRANLSLYYRKQTATDAETTTVKASAKENAFLKDLRTFVEDHMNDAQFNMQMLSQHMAMSHSQLHRKITALTGESTGKFVRSVRLSKAIELLKNSDLTVSEIAYETGFSDPGYFAKVFSKEYHMSPSEYKSNLSK